ncbi:MAG: hypothetical protein BWK76_15510 [Desulfobulbaceae bacterium A2]|nr:MAG: hypothetical protein BWK76_15510 [Desulfobulbaceae bacterium A2]
MGKSKDKLNECTGFEWDEGNSIKNWDFHNVAQGECEQIFFNHPLIVARDLAHSQTESRYYALGRTDAGRLLFIAFTIREKNIRVISARDMTRRECQRYLT